MPQVVPDPRRSRPTQALEMMADVQGHVWLEVPRVGEGAWRDWWVIAGTRGIIAAIRTPSNALPMFIGRSQMLLRRFNSAGVEEVQLCRYVGPA